MFRDARFIVVVLSLSMLSLGPPLTAAGRQQRDPEGTRTAQERGGDKDQGRRARARTPAKPTPPRRPVVVRGRVFVGGYFYDPFFGPYPWWGPGAYPYPYFPVYDDSAQVRLLVTPREAAVYVDGYYAGIVDDFDGAMQGLELSPGAHEITVFLEGYKTVHQKLYLTKRKSYKLRYALQPVAPGEASEAPPVAPPVHFILANSFPPCLSSFTSASLTFRGTFTFPSSLTIGRPWKTC